MATAKKDYFKFSRLVSLVLVIIPITAWVLGVVTRIEEKHYLAAIVRVFLGWIIWIADIVCMVMNEKILRVL